MQHLEVAFNKHTTFEHLTLLKLLPSIDSTNLNADHLLIAVIRCEVGRSLCLLNPGIPGDSVLDIVTFDIEAWFAILQNACGINLDVLVYAIDLAIELEGRVRLCVSGCVENLVDVLYTSETVD